MMTERRPQTKQTAGSADKRMTSSHDRPTRPTRAQRLVAFGFLGAFGLTMLTVLLTGLWVRSPSAHREDPAAHDRAEQPVEPAPAGAAPELPPDPNRTTDNTSESGAERASNEGASSGRPAQGAESTSGRAGDAPR
jgi:hypothetical protein